MNLILVLLFVGQGISMGMRRPSKTLYAASLLSTLLVVGSYLLAYSVARCNSQGAMYCQESWVAPFTAFVNLFGLSLMLGYTVFLYAALAFVAFWGTLYYFLDVWVARKKSASNQAKPLRSKMLSVVGWVAFTLLLIGAQHLYLPSQTPDITDEVASSLANAVSLKGFCRLGNLPLRCEEEFSMHLARAKHRVRFCIQAPDGEIEKCSRSEVWTRECSMVMDRSRECVRLWLDAFQSESDCQQLSDLKNIFVTEWRQCVSRFPETQIHHGECAAAWKKNDANYIIQENCWTKQDLHRLLPDHGETLLTHFVRTSERVTILKLIEASDDINAKNKDGATALEYAIDPEIRKILLRRGARTDKALLTWLRGYPHVVDSETLSLLRTNHWNPNEVEASTGNTALSIALFASIAYKVEMIDFLKLLVLYGSNPEIKNKQGKSARELAREAGLEKALFASE